MYSLGHEGLRRSRYVMISVDLKATCFLLLRSMQKQVCGSFPLRRQAGGRGPRRRAAASPPDGAVGGRGHQQGLDVRSSLRRWQGEREIWRSVTARVPTPCLSIFKLLRCTLEIHPPDTHLLSPLISWVVLWSIVTEHEELEFCPIEAGFFMCTESSPRKIEGAALAMSGAMPNSSLMHGTVLQYREKESTGFPQQTRTLRHLVKSSQTSKMTEWE